MALTKENALHQARVMLWITQKMMSQSNDELEEDEHEDVLRYRKEELGYDHAGAVGGDEDQGEQDVGHKVPPLLSTRILITQMRNF